jgi:SPOR domain
VGFKAKEVLHMSISDDPRGFRRGQQNASHPSADARRDDPRQPQRPDPRGNGARQGFQPRQDDSFASFPENGAGGDFVERPAPASQRQPSFSAFRPEAYADPAEKQSGRAEPQEWRQQNQYPGEPRAAPDKRQPARPQPEPFRPQPAAERGRAHDPYADASADPYDNGRSDFGNDWNNESFQPQQPNFAASNYYAQHDEPNPSEVQSVHNRFFAADPEPAAAQQPQAPQAQRYRQNDFSDQDYAPETREPPRAAKHAANHAPDRGQGNFDDGAGYRWDNFDQTPAPESVRPFPTAKLAAPDDDLDADYFADEEEFEGEDDYVEHKSGGSKKLMAAVLVGAVVTGGGLAYLYKSQSGVGNGEPPIMTADARPIKERPLDPGGREFPNGGKLIYDRLDNAGAASGVGGDEPTRVAVRQEGGQQNDVPGVVTTGASGTLEERIQNALQNAKKQDDRPASSQGGGSPGSADEPRRVRTEIFRPDGSLDATRFKTARTGGQAPAEGETALASGPSPRNAAPAAAPRANTRVAEVSPTAQIPQANITGGGEAGMFVQIAARNDQAAAMAAFADLQQKYAGVLGNHSPSVRKVDLGDKGVWYRLLVGPMASKGDADKLCEDLKTAGMKGCFSRKE